MSNMSKYGNTTIAVAGVGGLASEPCTQPIFYTAAEGGPPQAKATPKWLTAPPLDNIDSYYPSGVILNHKEEEVNPTYPPLHYSLVNHLGEPPEEEMVPRELLTGSEEVLKDTVNAYVCTICMGSGSSPLLTGKLKYEEYHEPWVESEPKPKGTLKAFFCTACNGTGIPPIPLGEFKV